MDVSLEAQTKPLATLSAFSYIPPRRTDPKESSYFNKESTAPEVSTYDLVFHQAEGYDPRLHRDDRKHHKGIGLDIGGEEESRVVPLRSSAQYGHRPVPAVCRAGGRHARVACINAEFFRKNGIIWNVAEGFGSVTPS
ncbi:cilia- and flagella-associated protein 90 [Pseudoliparis swirei]|uniref:cilia- and flagella-associated protein 90 n=1 Tax=Pseudoliparis swirei TaxID=2059687 RepID=UPI0024BE9415|nr:cilia- and flagella-associated protein 90 [Pseudoliparis swirei]